jgi:hypothetical protein
MDFISDDLGAMSGLELSKLVMDVRHFVISSAFITPFDDPRWEEMDPIYYKLHAELEGTKLPEGFDWKDALISVQAELRESLEDLQVAENEIIPVADVRLEITLVGGKFRVGYALPITYEECFDKDRLTQLAKISLCHALQDIPKDAIKRCRNKDCPKYFLHLSGKLRYYCSPQCTSRDLSRKRREKDPEAYRKKQREIMRRKYREKKAKKLGVSPNKVKIQKRASTGKKGGKK